MRRLVSRWLFRVPPCRKGTIHLQTSMRSPEFEPGPTAQQPASLTTIPDDRHQTVVNVLITNLFISQSSSSNLQFILHISETYSKTLMCLLCVDLCFHKFLFFASFDGHVVDPTHTTTTPTDDHAPCWRALWFIMSTTLVTLMPLSDGKGSLSRIPLEQKYL
ncbi:hypothetical protein TNCV_5078741 [Trichonephila clavipes]|nr:hypothetical protein TNCV_5078741 [Trichonephila clavipes]